MVMVYRSTQHYIPEDRNLHGPCSENLKSGGVSETLDTTSVFTQLITREHFIENIDICFML
jgi:hypothetical protein